jgi:hypothetical protein
VACRVVDLLWTWQHAWMTSLNSCPTLFVQGCQIWVNFGGSCNGRRGYILQTFDIFYGHLVYFMVIWETLGMAYLGAQRAFCRIKSKRANKFTGGWFTVFMLTLSYFPPAETFHRRKFAKVGKALLDTFFSQFLRHLRHASSKIRIHQLLESTILWRLSQ